MKELNKKYLGQCIPIIMMYSAYLFILPELVVSYVTDKAKKGYFRPKSLLPIFLWDRGIERGCTTGGLIIPRTTVRAEGPGPGWKPVQKPRKPWQRLPTEGRQARQAPQRAWWPTSSCKQAPLPLPPDLTCSRLSAEY